MASKADYKAEIDLILKHYGDGWVHWVEGFNVDDLAIAVHQFMPDWDCDWVHSEEEDFYDFKAWNCDNSDPDMETRLRILGE